MPSGIKRHFEDNIGNLSCLTDGPVEKSKRCRCIDSSGIDDDVLKTDIKIDRPAQVGILGIDDMVIREIAAGLQNRWIDRVSYDYSTNEKLDTLFHQIRSRG